MVLDKNVTEDIIQEISNECKDVTASVRKAIDLMCDLIEDIAKVLVDIFDKSVELMRKEKPYYRRANYKAGNSRRITKYAFRGKMQYKLVL